MEGPTPPHVTEELTLLKKQFEELKNVERHIAANQGTGSLPTEWDLDATMANLAKQFHALERVKQLEQHRQECTPGSAAAKKRHPSRILTQTTPHP